VPNIRYVNFNQLRSFFAVAKELSFTVAAKTLNVGQPTITTQVRMLEEDYGVELFHRLPKGIVLTEHGQALYTIARQIFRLEEEAVELLDAARGVVTGHLRVGTVGPFFVMKLLARFHNSFPLPQVSIFSGNSEDVLRDLLDFKTDVAVLGHLNDDPRLSVVRLSRHPVVVFVNAQHPWANRRQIKLRELDGQRMILREPGSLTRLVFERALEQQQVRPKVVMAVSRDAVREAVEEGLGIGIISEAEFKPGPAVKMLRLSDADVFTEAYAICLKSRRESRLISAFMEIAAELADAQPARTT
jgi:aminoethylphosphonate catabolism LysR family transcriptional regulator